MRNIVYYVASSLDGYIAGPNEDMSGFVFQGDGVDRYLHDLSAFDTVIMGRNTYEFGYKFGAQPGQPSPTYAHMMHYIFSNSLEFEQPHAQVQVKKLQVAEIEKIKHMEGTDIYLCGGGQFAGWLLENKLLDVLKIKLNPLILGNGIKIFEGMSTFFKTELISTETYDSNLQIITHKISYG